MLLHNKYKLSIEHIQKRNKELIESKWIDKLTPIEKKFLDFRKGEPQPIINKDGLFGYPDISNYLVNPDRFSEIQIENIKEYLIAFGVEVKRNISLQNITEDLTKLLKNIQDFRIKNIQKYILIEDRIFNKGIYANDTIYRVQDVPIEGNIIKNSTSWSLSPIEWFCNKKECHLYITKIPKKLKVIYLENDSKDKNLKTFKDFDFYEFEFILPRDLEFKEIKSSIETIPNKFFILKNLDKSKHKNQSFIVHYIKIVNKIKKSAFPVIDNVKLVSKMINKSCK